MNKYEIAAKTSLYSFIAMLILLILLNVMSFGANEGTPLFRTAQAIALVPCLLFIVPGSYLWITGFKRYRNYLGQNNLKSILYASCFTVGYAIYIQLKYGRQFDDQ